MLYDCYFYTKCFCSSFILNFFRLKIYNIVSLSMDVLNIKYYLMFPLIIQCLTKKIKVFYHQLLTISAKYKSVYFYVAF